MTGIKIKDIMLINPDHTIQTANIFIVDEKIAHIGINAPKDFRCDYLIDGRDKLAVPGFINTHTHAYMSGFRNWVDGISYYDLHRRLYLIEELLSPEDAYTLSLLSILEMIKSGITCFADVHKFPEATVTAATDMNMSAIVSRNLSGENSEEGDKQLEEAIEEYNKFKDNEHYHFMLAPESIYSCRKQYLHKISAVAKKYNLGIHSALSISREEVINCLGMYHQTPIEVFEECELLSNNTTIAHCTYPSDRDIDILSSTNTNVSINTCSSLKLGNELSPVSQMKSSGINLCLGTNGAAANNSLNMLREMQFTSLLSNSRVPDSSNINYNNNEKLSTHEVFDMATINGAKALGLGDKIGKLERGYNADIAIFDLEDISFTPLNDPISALCYATAGITAHTVICNGKIVLYEKQFTDIDTFKLIDNVMQIITDKIYQIRDTN